MHRMKKFSTGTSEYFNDILLSLYYKCPTKRLLGTQFGLFVQSMNDHTKNKKVQIKYGDDGTGIKFMLEIQKNKILFYEDMYLRHKFIEIANKNDYFNLMIEYPINVSYEDLLNLQLTFKKVIKKRNITIIQIMYHLGEEKEYGY